MSSGVVCDSGGVPSGHPAAPLPSSLDRLSPLASDPRTMLIAPPLVLAIALAMAGFGAAAISSCLVSLAIGHQLATWLCHAPDEALLAPLIDKWAGLEGAEQVENRKEQQQEESEERRKMPWDGIFVSAAVNESLESLIESIIDGYVNNWYESGIGRDRAFLNEIRYQFRYLVCQLHRRLSAFDVGGVIAREAIPAATLHLHRVADISDGISKSLPPAMVESRVCEELPDLHYALGSRANEADYLRQIADLLIPRLLDETRLAGRAHDDDSPTHRANPGRQQRAWPSQPGRHFLRELLVHAVLLPLMDMIADPDTLHHLLVLASEKTDGEGGGTGGVGEEKECVVPLLAGLTEPQPVDQPDSLLQLRLSDVLRDGRQLSMFRLYLTDTRGPVHELNFLAEATRIHEHMQKKDENSQETAYAVWQLYQKHVHESAPEKVDLSCSLLDEWQSAVETNSLEQLDRVLEASFQTVYQRLQHTHVLPFCQSEAFLGQLCGSPPVSLDELIELMDATNRKKPAGGAAAGAGFSLATFKSRLYKAMAMSGEEEEEGSGEMEEETCLDELAADASCVVGTPRKREHREGSEPLLDGDDGDDSLIPHSRSMPQLGSQSQLPSIDVSLSEEAELEEEEPSAAIAEPRVAVEETPSLIIDEGTRDMNKWKVTIPRIAPCRHPATGRTMYAYVVEVVRSEAAAHETDHWTILRLFHEFYFLEAKLNEFHGDAIRVPPLPPRKAFVTKTRAFVEQNRLQFAAFIGNLNKQRLLSRSDLLFSFLTSAEELREEWTVAQLNPWKAVRKMPAKLQRQKGQHLKPFILNLLANTLAPPDRAIEGGGGGGEGFEENGSVCSLGCSDRVPAPHSLYSPVYGNNCPNARVREQTGDGEGAVEGGAEEDGWTRSVTDSLLLVCLGESSWCASGLAAGRMLSRRAIDHAVTHSLDTLVKSSLSSVNVACLIQLTQRSLFADTVYSSEQEKALRGELARRRCLEWLGETVPARVLEAVGGRRVVERLLLAIQHPRLNKQLSYILLDIIIRHAFPPQH